MQGITSKILEYHFLFWPWPLPPVEKKKRKVAIILCRNREPVTSTCRIPLALTLQGKNKEPPTGRLQNMSKHGKLIMSRRIPCQRSYKANLSGIRIKLRKYNRVKVLSLNTERVRKQYEEMPSIHPRLLQAPENRLPK